MVLTLNIEKRERKSKNKALREVGKMPAVFYGKKQESTPVTVNTNDFMKVWKEAGESTVVVLKTPTGEFETLIHEVAIDPVLDTPIHADFYTFEKGEKLEVEVPLEFVGVSPAVKDLGGILVKVVHALSIEAEPSKLPQEIKVDISSIIEFGSRIYAKDIVLPAGVELVVDPDEVVALVSEPKEEESEETETAGLDSTGLDSIEVVGEKGKEEEEGEGVVTEDTKEETKSK